MITIKKKCKKQMEIAWHNCKWWYEMTNEQKLEYIKKFNKNDYD